MTTTPIYYANGQVLRDGEGNIYNHHGQIFIRNNGTITYPGGRTLRAQEHWGAFPWVLYYRSGDVLAQYKEIYYPKPSGATVTFKLFEGWSYFFDGQSQGFISQNWRDAQRIVHKNTVVAWNGREFRNPQNSVVNELSIYESIGQLGYLEIRTQNPSNPQMQSWIMFDLCESSYIWPIYFIHSHPEGISFTPLFDNFTIIIETGYWGELVMVNIQGSTVTATIRQESFPPPYPFPDPCPASVVANAHSQRPRVMANRLDPSDFIRKPQP